MEHQIVMTGIDKSFGDKIILNNISLQIEKGEIFGLLGPSGAGKTTLIKILIGQLKADSGQSFIGGINSRELDGTNYRNFGIVMDNFGLYDRLNCFDNLKIFARIFRICNEKIHQTLSDVGLSGSERTMAGNLSKGMTIRLKLARAFMTDPSILLLDEPTSGLDPASAQDIRSMIENERQKGKTILLTTHNMAEAEKLCGNIALLNNGKIAEFGTPHEICRRYNHLRQIRIHLSDGTDKDIPHTPAAAKIVAELLENNALETIHSTEPTLETVFMELTGKELSV